AGRPRLVSGRSAPATGLEGRHHRPLPRQSGAATGHAVRCCMVGASAGARPPRRAVAFWLAVGPVRLRTYRSITAGALPGRAGLVVRAGARGRPLAVILFPGGRSWWALLVGALGGRSWLWNEIQWGTPTGARTRCGLKTGALPSSKTKSVSDRWRKTQQAISASKEAKQRECDAGPFPLA